jgi:hypothetical protein
MICVSAREAASAIASEFMPAKVGKTAQAVLTNR